MGKVSAAILGALIGGVEAVAAMVFWFGLGLSGAGQAAHLALQGQTMLADYPQLGRSSLVPLASQ